MISLVLVGGAVLGAAIIDARTGKIPNWLTLPLVPLGVLLNTVTLGTYGLVQSLLGLLVCGAVPWILYRASSGEAIGGGDVKLFAGLGASLGPKVGLEAQFMSYVTLMLFALVYLAAKGQLWTLARGVLGLVIRLVRGRKTPESSATFVEMRMGPAIAVGTLAQLSLEQARHWL